MRFARTAVPASHNPVLPIPSGDSIFARVTSDRTLVSVLILSLFLDNLRIPAAGGLFNLRPSFVVFVAVFPTLAYRWVVRRETSQKTPLLQVLLLLDGIFFFSTLINPDAPYHLRGLISCLLLLFNIALYLSVVRFTAGSASALNHVYSLLIGVASAYALLAVVSLVLFELGFGPARQLVQLIDIGDLTMNGGNTPTPRSWLLEPNMGSYLAAIGVMALIRSGFSTGRARVWLGLASATIFVGVLLSYSRGAWLAAAVGLATAGLIVLMTRRGVSLSPAKLGAVGAIFVLAIAGSVIAAPSVKTVLVARVANLLNIESGTGSQRLAFWVQITEDALRKPVLGHGSDAYRVLLPPPPASCQSCGPYVAENITVEIFHTSGFVGLAAFLGLQVLLVRLVIRGLRRSGAGSGRQRGLAIAAAAAYVTIIVAAQANPSFWGNMHWALLAVAVASALEAAAPSPYRQVQKSEVGV